MVETEERLCVILKVELKKSGNHFFIFFLKFQDLYKFEIVTMGD